MRISPLLQQATLDLRTDTGRALAWSGIWMMFGYVGASVLVLGLLRLFSGEGNALVSLAWSLGGGAFAAFAWRSAYRALDRVDPPQAGQARAATERSTSGLTTLIGAPEA